MCSSWNQLGQQLGVAHADILACQLNLLPRPHQPLPQGLIEGWRNELYPAVQSFHDEPAFLIERAAAPHFGIKAYGACCCHVLHAVLCSGAVHGTQRTFGIKGYGAR